MKKSLLILYILLLQCALYKAQAQLTNKTIEFASPNVSELKKYSAIPVDHYTGVANVSIPIYTIEAGEISVPISLNYHSSGIRVSDEATDVGLGWSLQAGGIITRVVNDQCDFEGGKVKIPTDTDFQNGRIPSLEMLTIYSQNNLHDTEPDVFTYRFLNHSGKFFLDENRQVVDLKGEKQLKFDFSKKIRLYNRDRTVIGVTDQSGIKYEFEKVEEVSATTNTYNYDMISNRLDYLTGQNALNVNTWFLTKITSSDNEHVITFNYTDVVYLQSTRMNGEVYYSGAHSERRWRGSTVLEPNFDIREFSSFHQSNMDFKTQQLTSIVTNKGIRIEFGRSFPRKDTSHNTGAVSHIRVSYNNNQVKKWYLTYSYFESNIKHPSNLNTYENYRLRLDEIVDDTRNDSYKFTYYNDIQMPYKTAMDGTDHWGFLNSASITNESCNNPKKLFPNVSNQPFLYKEPSGHIANQTVSFTEGSSKEPNLNCCRTYSLKTIKHITGAETTFDYELHSYSMYGGYNGDITLTVDTKCGGLRIRQIADRDPDGHALIRNYTYTEDTGSVSSGILYNMHKNLEERWTNICQFSPSGSEPIATDVNYLALSSSSYSSIHSIDGDYMNYSQVNVNDGTGITSYHYNVLDGSVYFSGFIYLGYESILGGSQSFFPIYSPSGGTEREAKDTGRNLKAYNSKTYKRGLLHKVIYKDYLNKIKKQEDYVYSFEDEGRVYGMVCKSGFDQYVCQEIPWGYDVIVNLYFHDVGRSHLKKKTVTEYRESGPITFTEEYAYNSQRLINRQTIIASDSSVQENVYMYPNDIVSQYSLFGGVLYDMVGKNILNKPIETVSFINSGFTKGIVNIYQKNGNYINLVKVHETTHTSPLPVYKPYNGRDLNGYDPVPVIEYKYDCDRIVEIKDRAGSTAYLWSYNTLYPIAEIKNSSYQNIVNILGPSAINRIASSAIPTNSDMALIDGLRINPFIEGTLNSTYKYRPLVGITSATHPDGSTTTYDYDLFGRLIRVTGPDGKAVENYQYNYKQ